MGIVVPMLVWQHPQKKGAWEVIAGHRRLAAAKLLKNWKDLDAPARVIEASDDQVLELMLTENGHRDDLTPLEEAKTVQMLLDRGWTYAQIGDRMGRSARWAARRASLTGLSEEWLAMLSDANQAVTHWPAGHLEMIARLPEKVQDELSTEYYHNSQQDWKEADVRAMSAAELGRDLAREMRVLERATWDLTDPLIGENKPACACCPHRTGAQALLWEEDDPEDRCLNSECFQEKQRWTLLRDATAFLDQHENALLMAEKPENWEVPNVHKYVYSKWRLQDWDKVKKPKKGWVPCFYLGRMHGREGGPMWAIPQTKDAAEKTAGGPKPMKLRREELQAKRIRLAATQLVMDLEAIIPDPLVEHQKPGSIDYENLMDTHFPVGNGKVVLCESAMIAYVLAMGTDHRRDYRGGHTYEIGPGKDVAWPLAQKMAPVGKHEEALVRLFMSALKVQVRRLNGLIRLPGDQKDTEAECVDFCGFVGWDWPARLAVATETIPEPKSWARLNEDGTPRKADSTQEALKAIEEREAKTKAAQNKKRKAAKKKVVKA